MIKKIIYIGGVNGYAIYYDRKKQIPLTEKGKPKRIRYYLSEISLGFAIYLSHSISRISLDVSNRIPDILFWQLIILIMMIYIVNKTKYPSKEYEPASYEEFYCALYNEKIIGADKNDEYISLFKGLFIWIVNIVCILEILYYYLTLFDEGVGSSLGSTSIFINNYISQPLFFTCILYMLYINPFYYKISCFRKFRNRTLFKDQESIYEKDIKKLNVYPLGSIVKIKGNDDKYILIKREVEIKANDNKKYYDYAAYKVKDIVNKEKEYNFNHWDISEIIYVSSYQKLRSEQDYQLIYPLIREEKIKKINSKQDKKIIISDKPINIIDSSVSGINKDYEKLIEDLKIEPFGIKKEGNDEK